MFEQEIGIGHSARYGVIVGATHQKEIGCGKNRYVDARIGETPGGLLKLARRQQRKLGHKADRYAATAVEIPPIEVISRHTPNGRTPTGSKGMAEGGVMGATGALPSAVNDALAPFGVITEAQPLSPMYIRSLLRSVRR